MAVYYKIIKDHYIDSLETLAQTTKLCDQPGIETGYVGMATQTFKDIVSEIGLACDQILAASEGDYVVAAKADTEEAFEKALKAISESASGASSKTRQTYLTVEQAASARPQANLCQISVPGEFALDVAKRALNAGMHLCVFSNNVPLEDEREMKELAREKGLLCMGPDCGVANINGSALVLSSIVNRGPFGIIGASGTGIQHVTAMLHEAGSGVSQAIGAGGNDIKEQVGGITMLMGIDALEEDPETKYLILIARKPAPSVLEKMLERLRSCRKPRVVYFMGCDRKAIEDTGSIYAGNLDECGERALELAGLACPLESEEEILALARKEAEGFAREQKYLRGAYSGGTYMDEAMRVMVDKIGPIWSNAPLEEAWRLEDSLKPRENACIDYGEEEFTLGRPHPAIDAGIRRPAILKEAADPEVAVITLDFILTPPGHPDPAGFVVPDIIKAQEMARERGGKLVFIASLLGTTADYQDIRLQEKKLRDAGAIVCRTNYRAALLASEIIRLIREKA